MDLCLYNFKNKLGGTKMKVSILILDGLMFIQFEKFKNGEINLYCFNPYFRWTYVYTYLNEEIKDLKNIDVSILILDGLMFIRILVARGFEEKESKFQSLF